MSRFSIPIPDFAMIVQDDDVVSLTLGFDDDVYMAVEDNKNFPEG